jgi:uncharacterized OsmC-like protein
VTPSALKDLYRRLARALGRRPALARRSGQATARVGATPICEVRDGEHLTHVDLPAHEGGDVAGPDPEQLLRASVCASLATGCAAWAVCLDVPVDSVVVELTCDYDTRGRLGLDPSIPAGWQRLCLQVTVVSDAPETSVRDLVAIAARRSPVLASLASGLVRIPAPTVLRRGSAGTTVPTTQPPTERSVPFPITPSR